MFASFARIINQNVAHLPNDYSEEMHAIPPINLLAIQEPYKTLIYQVASLDSMATTLTAQAAGSKTA